MGNDVYKMGIDIGSTTLKISILDEHNRRPYFLKDIPLYRRHNANPSEVGIQLLEQIQARLGDIAVKVCMTGSVGMGYAEHFMLPFEQEVIATVEVIRTFYPEVRTLIDMGGEDCKMIFFPSGRVPVMRMNGNCAGGTGSFIDQTAILLGVEVNDLNALAEGYEAIYPIASRCGVFSKTDIQNLLARNVSKSDIVASMFRAVSMQAVSALARGMEVESKVFLCGGPFAYIPQLRTHMLEVLNFNEADCIVDEHPELIPATGCALLAQKEVVLSDLIHFFSVKKPVFLSSQSQLEPLFTSKKEYEAWLEGKRHKKFPIASFDNMTEQPYFLGVDSGSTTTKIVLLNAKGEIVYRDYAFNQGDTFTTFRKALERMKEVLQPSKKSVFIATSTGYGEALLKTAFSLQYGIVETMAHFIAAKHLNNDVSFILDIGGQDMKAIFVKNDAIQRIEINEACSSGCGSFLMTFANQLGYTMDEFADLALYGKHPYDLGTRCTVFMNSKVKQAMREGATVEDIAAGLSYSVIKNCLYKVLKLRSFKELGCSIIVQGGTFKNHSVIHALEKLTKTEVQFSDMPEMMGAIGSALYSKQQFEKQALI